MRERNSNSSAGRVIQFLRDTLDLFTPSRTLKKTNSSRTELFSRNGEALEGWELKDVCSLEENSLPDLIATEPPKPFTGLGSFLQKHGSLQTSHPTGENSLPSQTTLSSEAPAKLGTGLCKGRSDQLWYSTLQSKQDASSIDTESKPSGAPVDIRKERHRAWDSIVHKTMQKQRSFCSDIDRNEAWERKRDIFLMDVLDDTTQEQTTPLVRSISDCCDRTLPMPGAKIRSRTRTRSLTDEDLEELRGCIDLGFGFSDDESSDLRNTFPALDLYYAINRQYNDMKSRSSPVSPLDSMLGPSSSRGGSPGSPRDQTWRISSPGDNPNQVKTRLRHWAQAVACSIRQGSSSSVGPCKTRSEPAPHISFCRELHMRSDLTDQY